MPNSLQQRVLEPEDIDDPALETEALFGALRGLETINFLSASSGALWPAIRSLAQRTGKKRLRVLDIATGAGDVPLALWRKATRSGIELELHGIDISERALEFARKRTAAAKAVIQFSKLDIFQDPLPADYDVVTCSLFYHHLENAAAVKLLRASTEATQHLVLINDLRRHWWGLLLSHFAGNVLTRSPVVRRDAVRSVRAAFTIEEMKLLAAEAGVTNYRLRRTWPCRFVFEWERK